MDTLIVTGVAVGVCVAIGMPTAIWMAGSHRATTLITPVLDVMQTLPAFAYLAPLVLFFSINAASAVVVTLIYALPPLIRISASALRSVEPATVEATRSIGATSWQLLRQVQLPMARRTILVGLNQTTMAALSMATIAALINGPGLGRPVVKALQALDIGGAAVSGLCIVLVAIMLDRVTTAAGERSETARRAQRDPRTRRLLLVGMTVPTLVAVLLSRRSYWAAEFPDDAGLGARLATWLSDVNETVVDVIRPATQAFRDLVSYNLLNPLQSLLAESPWWLMAGVLVVLAFLLGGVRATVPTVVCVGRHAGHGAVERVDEDARHGARIRHRGHERGGGARRPAGPQPPGGPVGYDRCWTACRRFHRSSTWCPPWRSSAPAASPRSPLPSPTRCPSPSSSSRTGSAAFRRRPSKRRSPPAPRRADDLEGAAADGAQRAAARRQPGAALRPRDGCHRWARRRRRTSGSSS
jgi:ABC-type proline/glycine betaine transport system permease subunit